MRVQFNQVSISEDAISRVAQSIRACELAGNGERSKQIEKEIGDTFFGGRRVLLTPSCSGALEMAVRLCGIQPGDEVVMPSFTFTSCANAVALAGGVPVFVDIEPSTLNIDPEAIANAITERTRAVMIIHYAGRICDMEKINHIASKHGLKIIEDAAHAIGSSWRNHAAGTLGDFSCFSFHTTKNITCGEGGALVVKDPDNIAAAEILHEKGTNRSKFLRGEVDRYHWLDLGSSFLMPDYTAVLLSTQIAELETITKNRRKIWQVYYDGLSPLASAGKLGLLDHQDDGSRYTNAHVFGLLAKTQDVARDLSSFLRHEQIGTAFHYVPLHSSPAGQRYGRTTGSLAVTEDIAPRLLRLPVHQLVSPELAGEVCDLIRRFFAISG